ncbi:hypothetical protein Tco_0314101 [Tanacetum coccineum]
MTGDRARLINFVEKFIGTVRFGNDEYAAIIGYGDYKLGDTIISRVYYVEGLKHNLFSVGQFCDGGLELHQTTVMSTSAPTICFAAYKSPLPRSHVIASSVRNHLKYGLENELASII